MTNRKSKIFNLHTKRSNDYYELSEIDFYPPQDDRLYISLVEDIDGGDNFADYVKSFLKNYEKELFDN